jgi:hypothetical protein
MPLAILVLLIAGALLCFTTSGLSQTNTPGTTLASAQQKYLGAQVRIKGPLESSSPGLSALYINWRIAKKDPHGRYHGVTRIDSGRLPYGYERHSATIIAVQWSDNQPKDSRLDVTGSSQTADQLSPNFDFVVRFDDGVTGVSTCSLANVAGNFVVVTSKPNQQK